MSNIEFEGLDNSEDTLPEWSPDKEYASDSLGCGCDENKGCSDKQPARQYTEDRKGHCPDWVRCITPSSFGQLLIRVGQCVHNLTSKCGGLIWYDKDSRSVGVRESFPVNIDSSQNSVDSGKILLGKRVEGCSSEYDQVAVQDEIKDVRSGKLAVITSDCESDDVRVDSLAFEQYDQIPEGFSFLLAKKKTLEECSKEEYEFASSSCPFGDPKTDLEDAGDLTHLVGLEYCEKTGECIPKLLKADEEGKAKTLVMTEGKYEFKEEGIEVRDLAFNAWYAASDCFTTHVNAVAEQNGSPGGAFKICVSDTPAGPITNEYIYPVDSIGAGELMTLSPSIPKCKYWSVKTEGSIFYESLSAINHGSTV